jgi:hypothetical protein
MKKFTAFLPVLIIAFLAGSLASCEKLSPENQAKGKLEIAIDISEGMLKSALTDTVDSTDPDPAAASTSFHILISVENQDGILIMEDELIPVYNFGNGFVSNRVEFEVGSYKLTKFMVINPSGNVVFASPVSGSPKSYLVMNPLPIGFVIHPENVTRVIPEVLAVINESPQDFGYAGFGFHVVRPLSFYVMAIIDNPLIMAPTQATEALLTVHTPKGWKHSFKLEPRVNKVIVRGGEEYYILIGEKEGFPPVKMRVSARQLHTTTPENPIIIPFGGEVMNVLKLKPGAGEGNDAMITNLNPEQNFGSHRYFEATYLSEPVLTVMRANRSLIWFDIGQLPKSATIKRVTLSLFRENLTPWDYINAGNSENSDISKYAAVLQQIVEPWDEHKVNWNNQPKTTEANQVLIYPPVDSKNYSEETGSVLPGPGLSNVLKVDVTPLFVPVDKVDLPNYGMLFKLYPTEEYPGGYRFGSSDHPNERLHPELSIFYTLPTD